MRDPVDSQTTYNSLMQAPVLYDSAFSDTSTQGLVTLSDCIECNVTFNTNNFPTLQMTYPRDGVGAQLLDYDKVILTDISWKWTHQKFRIQQIQRDGDNYVISASHIAADLLYRPVCHNITLPNASAVDVFNQMINDLAGDDKQFDFDSNVTKVSNVNIEANVAGNILIDPDQEGDEATNSIIGLYGGELEFDNRMIYHKEHAGRSTGIVVSYGKNLQTIQDDTNLDGTYTAIYPIATYTPGQPKATSTNLPWSNWESEKPNTFTNHGTVTYNAGGLINIYDMPIKGQKVIRTITNGSKLILGEIVTDGEVVTDPANPKGNGLEIDTVNGDSWYPIQGGGWIDAAWVNFSKKGDYLVNSVTGHVTIGASDQDPTAWSTREYSYGYLIVNYQGIRVFSDPERGTHPIPGRHLNKGDKYRFDMVAYSHSGAKWYEIGKNQWVYGPHVRVDIAGGNQQYNVTGSTYVKSGAQRYHWNSKKKELVADGKQTITTTKKVKAKYRYVKVGNKKKRVKTTNGHYYKQTSKKVRRTVAKGVLPISRVIVQNGETYYKTSKGWVKEDDTSFDHVGAHKVKSIDDYQKQMVTDTGSIEMYADPNRTKDLNMTIPVGTSLDVVSNGQSYDGTEMYEVTYNGVTGWIRAELTNTNGDIDKEPTSVDDTTTDDGTGDTSDANVTSDNTDVTVEVGVLYCDTTVTPENARIERVDLSQYFTHDDTDTSGQVGDKFYATEADKAQLTQLAYDYMKEHNYGHPQTSLTVSYQQLTGLAGDSTQLNLYDYVLVDYPKLGISVPAEVTSTVWDCIAHRYTQVTIGDLPKTYLHLLKDSVKQDTSELKHSISQANSTTHHLFYDIHQALQAEGKQREEAELAIADRVGLVEHTTAKNGTDIANLTVTQAHLDTQLQRIDSQTQEITNELLSGGSATLQFLDQNGNQNFLNPTQIAAVNSDGTMLILNSNGIGFYDRYRNIIRTAITSDGKLAAESIAAGTIDAVTINSAKFKGELEVDDGTIHIAIGSPKDNKFSSPLDTTFGGNGIRLDSSGYHSLLSSGKFETNQVGGDTWNYGTDGVSKNGTNLIDIIMDKFKHEIQNNYYVIVSGDKRHIHHF